MEVWPPNDSCSYASDGVCAGIGHSRGKSSCSFSKRWSCGVKPIGSVQTSRWPAMDKQGLVSGIVSIESKACYRVLVALSIAPAAEVDSRTVDREAYL